MQGPVPPLTPPSGVAASTPAQENKDWQGRAHNQCVGAFNTKSI